MEPAIAIYIGAPVSIGSEVKALCQLHNDLQKTGVSASLLVNFEVGGRQIDCVVVTERQATMLDFKNLSGPIKGGVNGPWILSQYGGAERSYDGENPYQQALDAKFKLANALKDFHQDTSLGVAPDKGQFVRLFDAAVCVYPSIDPKSTVRGDFKCWIWGYAEAFSKIATRELTPRWSIQDWSRFAAEHLHLGKVTFAAAISPDHRKAEKTLTAYAQALRDELSAEIFPDLPGPATSLPTDQHVSLIGPSGIGKTVRLKRQAVSLSHDDRLVLFCSGRHYTDSLERLLSRSVSPFSKKTPSQLLAAADKCGWGVDLIIDGIDGFATSRQNDLVEGVTSFVLRYNARVIISSMGEINLSPAIKGETLNVPALTDDQKLAIFNFHAGTGCVPPSEFLTAFETAHDIMVAAKAASSVPSGSSRVDYYAACVFESLPADCRTVANALLRDLAGYMHQQFVRSIEFTEFERKSSNFLQTMGARLEIADRVTELPQVSAVRGVFSFKHDLWQDYFAAEWLSSTTGPEAILYELTKPINRRLASHAIGRIRDQAVLGKVIEGVCDAELITDGFAGGLGQQSKAFLERTYQRLWDDLLIDAGDLQVLPMSVEESSDGKQAIMEWPQVVGKRTWSGFERNVAQWVSARLHQPEIAPKFIELLENSSLVIWGASEAAACRTKVSAPRIFSNALHVLFHLTWPNMPLTAFSMFRTWEQSRWMGRSHRDPNLAFREKLLDRVAICPNEAKGAVLFCLATILRCDECPAPDVLSHVFHLGWSQRVRPVRQEVLSLIQWHGSDLAQKAPELAEPVRQKLEAALGDNPISNTFIFEALNALGAVPPPVSTEEALAELRETIDSPDEVSDCVLGTKSAAGLVSNFFEDIFQGAYWEAYATLSLSEKIRFMNLTAAQADAGFNNSFILRELVTFSDESSKDVFQAHAARLCLDDPMQQEAVASWCLAIIGCARLDLPLPTWQGGTDVASQAWRIIGELLYKEHLGEGSSSEADELWLTLRSEAVNGAADVFLHLQGAEGTIGMDSKNQELECWGRLLRHPAQVRDLMEHSLLQLDHLVSMSKWNMRDRRDPFVVRVLGAIGNQSTVAVLRQFVGHSTVAIEAVAAIEKINGRASLY